MTTVSTGTALPRPPAGSQSTATRWIEWTSDTKKDATAWKGIDEARTAPYCEGSNDGGRERGREAPFTDPRRKNHERGLRASFPSEAQGPEPRREWTAVCVRTQYSRCTTRTEALRSGGRRIGHDHVEPSRSFLSTFLSPDLKQLPQFVRIIHLIARFRE